MCSSESQSTLRANPEHNAPRGGRGEVLLLILQKCLRTLNIDGIICISKGSGRVVVRVLQVMWSLVLLRLTVTAVSPTKTST